MARRFRVLAGVIFTMVMLPVLSTAVPGDDDMVSRQEGKALYQKNCSGCHGDLGDSAKGGRSMNRVRTAIRTLHPHKDLASMLDEQILLIALVLKDVKD